MAEDGRKGLSSFEGCLDVTLGVLPLTGCLAASARPRGFMAAMLKAAAAAANSSSSGGGGSGRKEEGAEAEQREDVTKGSTSATSSSTSTSTSGSTTSTSAVAGSSREGRALQEAVLPHLQQQASSCLLEGLRIPPLSGTFIANENLFWTIKALGLSAEPTLQVRAGHYLGSKKSNPHSSQHTHIPHTHSHAFSLLPYFLNPPICDPALSPFPQELYDAGSRHCSIHWASLHAQFSGHVPDKFLTRYCFGAAYIFNLLHHGLGMGLEERRIRYTNTLRSPAGGPAIRLGWVTGACVCDAMRAERNRGLLFMGRGGLLPARVGSPLAALALPGAAVLAAGGLLALQRRRRKGAERHPISLGMPRVHSV